MSNEKSYRNQALDGFRGLGCLLVLFGHTQWNKGTILPGAVVAMDLFFVLSGFLITGLLLSEFKKTGSINFVSFWGRRAMRLLPTFYVYFAFGALFYYISKFQPVVGTDPTVTLLSTAFYFSNWAVAKGYELGVFTVTWSLSLEEQFYFLCPLLFLFCLKYFNKKTVMILLGVAIVAVNIHRYHLFHSMMESHGVLLAWKRCFYALDTRSDSLMIGCFAAIFYNLYKDKFKIGTALGFGALMIFFASIAIRDLPVAYHIPETSAYTEFLMTGGFSFFSIIGVLIIMHLIQNPDSFVSKFFSTTLLVKVGIMSYSIYLWHTTIFGGLELVLKNMNATPAMWALKTLIRFSVALGVGYLSFRFIELPILKAQNKKRKYAPLPDEASSKGNES